MAMYAFSAFVMYLLSFIVSQNVIGHIRHVRNIGSPEAPGKLILSIASLILLFPAVDTMENQQPMILPWMIAGAVVTLLGLALSMRAQWELGRYWVGGVALHKDHKLITTGPYRFVRHPLYSGMLVSAIGLGLFGQNIWFALAMCAFLGAFSVRILGEEFLLQKKFAKQYPAYRASTGMLFPRIRKRG